MLKIIIFVLILCCTPIGLYFGPSTMNVDAKQPVKNPIMVRLASSPVGPPAGEKTGFDNTRIKYLGTLLLSSPHPAFGGFSDLLVSPDRKTFLAVSDMGFWIKAGIKYTPEGELAGTDAEAQLGQLRNTEGNTYAIKYNADAEGLSRAPGSGYLVSFERVHRINRFDNKELSLAGTPVNFPVPEAVKDLPENAGLESLLLLPDQRLMVLSEGEPSQGNHSYAAVVKDGSWTEFTYVRSDDFRPTSAGNLPGNKILVLERRYTGPGSLGIRFSTFGADEISSGAGIVPCTLFEIKNPLPRDNFEGLDTITAPDGTTYIYIISDDNFSPVQHTLLSLFKLSPEQ
ncbi:esterase-like activity of phytase family protein [Maridesulfovibrio sp.]|uniref:esterase-like activity of phytase family protein n=1 Tax=Maridesulfovibrio sp. TaxID=2795000 RepID=UPI002A18BD21|nr:esterase-like activity of phytase family protein [Maridesulfovibrio sp.]